MGETAKNPGNRRQAALKYAVLQLPSKLVLLVALLLMREWLGWSTTLIWLLLGVWLVIDVALFPFVWRAYDPTARGTQHDMVGLRGRSRERLDPAGFVRVRGEFWRATVLGDPIDADREVEVVAKDGLLLRVVAVRDPESPSGPPETAG